MNERLNQLFKYLQAVDLTREISFLSDECKEELSRANEHLQNQIDILVERKGVVL